jgi:hypothetical protein
MFELHDMPLILPFITLNAESVANVCVGDIGSLTLQSLGDHYQHLSVDDANRMTVPFCITGILSRLQLHMERDEDDPELGAEDIFQSGVCCLD